jgi:hypothetical protein
MNKGLKADGLPILPPNSQVKYVCPSPRLHHATKSNQSRLAREILTNRDTTQKKIPDPFVSLDSRRQGKRYREIADKLWPNSFGDRELKAKVYYKKAEKLIMNPPLVWEKHREAENGMVLKRMRNRTSAQSRQSEDRAIDALLSSTSNLATGKRVATAMSRIYVHLESSGKQVRTIEAPKVFPFFNYDSGFHPRHPYFICLAALGQIIEVIQRRSGMEAQNKVWKKSFSGLKRYTEARYNFGHNEERLHGGTKASGLQIPSDYGFLPQQKIFDCGVTAGRLTRIASNNLWPW